MNQSRIPFLVIGGGLGGLTTALALAGIGLVALSMVVMLRVTHEADPLATPNVARHDACSARFPHCHVDN